VEFYGTQKFTSIPEVIFLNFGYPFFLLTAWLQEASEYSVPLAFLFSSVSHSLLPGFPPILAGYYDCPVSPVLSKPINSGLNMSRPNPSILFLKLEVRITSVRVSEVLRYSKIYVHSRGNIFTFRLPFFFFFLLTAWLQEASEYSVPLAFLFSSVSHSLLPGFPLYWQDVMTVQFLQSYQSL